MTERERLVELLKNVPRNTRSFYAQFADYLLANGVIVPPVKVGDMVYILAGPFGKKYEQDVCEGFYIGNNGVLQVRTRNKKGNHGTYGVIGETVFLTKEEAEKALKERQTNENT